MALPAPPAAPPAPPSTLTIIELDDLPAVPGVPAGPTTLVVRSGLSSGSVGMQKAARVGLVLAVVVALAGVVGAFTKSSGDGGGLRVAGEATSDPLAGAPADETDDPFLVPDGYQLVQGDGVYLAVPAGWRSLDRQVLARMFDEDTIAELYPDMPEEERGVVHDAVRSGVLFLTIDPDPAHHGRNISIARLPGRVPLSQIRGIVANEFEVAGLAVEITSTREVETPLGTAMRVEYEGTIVGEHVVGVQYYAPADDGEMILVTGTGDPEATDQAAQTLHLGEAPKPA
jgi:hypothetical protein